LSGRTRPVVPTGGASPAPSGPVGAGLVRPVAPTADVVTEHVELCGRELSVVRPRDAEALLDEEAFDREEFLPYWAELWPSGLALARILCARSLLGARVLEVGCGLALPSLAAGLRGARVLASDWAPDAVALTADNAERNGVQIETALADWARPDALVARGPWDLVLAADVLYERRNVELLLALLPRLVAPEGELLLAEPGRPPARAFFAAAPDRWTVRTVAEHESPRVVVHSLKLKP
jgi:predicted nicotinamide N-methyase